MEAKNEKIKENHCKFVIQFNSIQFNSIQFNSIQFNSIPKIISLIALLFILLFLVSCSSNEDPIEDDNKERTLSYYAGTWMVWGSWKESSYGWTQPIWVIYFTINSDGSITHKKNNVPYGGKYYSFFDKDETIPATSIKRINDTNFTYSFKTGRNEIRFYSDKEGLVGPYDTPLGIYHMLSKKEAWE